MQVLCTEKVPGINIRHLFILQKIVWLVMLKKLRGLLSLCFQLLPQDSRTPLWPNHSACISEDRTASNPGQQRQVSAGQSRLASFSQSAPISALFYRCTGARDRHRQHKTTTGTVTACEIGWCNKKTDRRTRGLTTRERVVKAMSRSQRAARFPPAHPTALPQQRP